MVFSFLLLALPRTEKALGPYSQAHMVQGGRRQVILTAVGLAQGSSPNFLLMPMRSLISFQPQATAAGLHRGVPCALVSNAAVSHPFLGISLNVRPLEEVCGGTKRSAHPSWRDQRVCTPFVEDSRVLLAEKRALFMDL